MVLWTALYRRFVKRISWSCLMASLLLAALLLVLAHPLALHGEVDSVSAAPLVESGVIQDAPTNTPMPTATATPYPPEFATNSQQTIGLTLAATILVVIVIGGVVLFMPKKSES